VVKQVLAVAVLHKRDNQTLLVTQQVMVVMVLQQVSQVHQLLMLAVVLEETEQIHQHLVVVLVAEDLEAENQVFNLTVHKVRLVLPI
tara:strand:+ start:201 stop:461 length:261 start_codon:yes stop_codon:yes gene_type:complete